MDKLVYTNTINPTSEEVEQMLEVVREQLIGGLAALHLGGRALPVASDTILVSDLLAAALEANTAEGAITISEKDFKTVEGHLIRLVLLGQGRDATVLGRRVYSPTGELVGERLRSPASARFFHRREKGGGETAAPAANRFLASWAAPRVRGMTRRLGIAERPADLVHSSAQWVERLDGYSRGTVPVSSFCSCPELLADPIAEAPRRAAALKAVVPDLGYRDLQRVAKALDLPAGGKAETLREAVAAKAILWANVPKAAEAHAEALAMAHAEVLG
jgi:hypothetical protein